MRCERMRGATIRAIARLFGVSKSLAWLIVAEVEILPLPPENPVVLVQLPSGGFTWRHGAPIPRHPRAYKVRNHRRLYPGMG